MKELVSYRAYRVKTTAGRELDLLFRGRPTGLRRLWFTELDPPYADVFLRPRHIVSCEPLDGQRHRC